jgi:hypothetical protein
VAELDQVGDGALSEMMAGDSMKVRSERVLSYCLAKPINLRARAAYTPDVQLDWYSGKISRSIVIAIFIGGLVGACGDSEPSRTAIGVANSESSSVSPTTTDGTTTGSAVNTEPVVQSESTQSTRVLSSETSTIGPPSTVLNSNKKFDNDGPKITSISVSQNTVAPGDTFTVSINANDPSGISDVSFSFSVNGGQRDFCGQNTTRTSGTAENGTWTYNCTVPNAVIGGTYTVIPFATDSLRNSTNTNCCSSSPVRATFTVA